MNTARMLVSIWLELAAASWCVIIRVTFRDMFEATEPLEDLDELARSA